MQHTKYNAFGYTLVRTQVQKDEIITDTNHEHTDNTLLITRPYNPNFKKQSYVTDSINHIWLTTSGNIKYTNLYTGAVVNWSEGYCSLDNPMPVGFWAIDHEEDSTAFCFSPRKNLEMDPVMPDVSTFKMDIGESITVNEQKRLFLCQGQLSIEGQSVTGPTQVIISSGRTITATTKIYGFEFN